MCIKIGYHTEILCYKFDIRLIVLISKKKKKRMYNLLVYFFSPKETRKKESPRSNSKIKS